MSTAIKNRVDSWTTISEAKYLTEEEDGLNYEILVHKSCLNFKCAWIL